MCIFQTYVFLDTEVDEKSQGSSYSFLLTTADSMEMLASLSPLMLAQHPEEIKSSPLPWVPDQSELEAEIPAWIPAVGVQLTKLSGSFPGNMKAFKDLVYKPSLFWLSFEKQTSCYLTSITHILSSFLSFSFPLFSDFCYFVILALSLLVTFHMSKKMV